MSKQEKDRGPMVYDDKTGLWEPVNKKMNRYPRVKSIKITIKRKGK